MEAVSKDAAAATARRRRAKRAYVILGAVATVVAVAWFGHSWLTKNKESTDDAQVEADVVPLAARVGGVIKLARVTDNQRVAAGDPLFELDAADLDVAVERAAAELDAARAQLAAADAQVAIAQSSSSGGLSSARAALTGAGASVRSAGESMRAADASIARAVAELGTADADLARATSLFEKQANTRYDLEHAQQARDVAKAALDAATAQREMAQEQHGLARARVAEAEGRVTQSAPVGPIVAAAEAAGKLAAARVKAAEAALQTATLQRGYATVTAPFAGTISKLGAHAGQHVVAGQTLLMLVPLSTHVVANFKESQVGRMEPGDAVDVEIDAYPDLHLKGIVEALSPATGARFSLIPPDNATGNFVKVVQRVPVKIKWTTTPTQTMRPGLSAEVIVHVKP